MDGLDLQAMVPALHGGVVVTVAFLAHAGDEAMGLSPTAHMDPFRDRLNGAILGSL